MAIANLGLLVMTLLWGAFFPFLEQLLTRWDAFSVTLARQLFGTLALGIGVFAARRAAPLPVRIPWGSILVLGGIGVSLGSLLTSLGVLYSSGLSSAIISTTNPVTSALTAAALTGEPLGRGVLFGTVLSVLGGLVAVGSDAATGARFEGGEVFIVIANVAWTWMSMAAQRWLGGMSQLQITFVTVAGGAFWLLAALPFVALLGVDFRIDPGFRSLLLMAFTGMLPIGLGGFFWHYGVSRIGVVVASMYNNLLPMAAVAVTVLFGGIVYWQQLGGAGIILIGVLTAQLLALRRARG